MTTRDKLLIYFDNHKGESISGERLAEEINVSRNAVWKAINALRKDGYLFEAFPGRGYSLLKESEKLSAQSILRYMKNSNFFNISVHNILPSTNDYVKKAAESGEVEGFVAIANEQSSGKGRMGRGFFSPTGDGIYMSILLRPKFPATEAVLITTAAAVAVSKAIEDVSGINASIKWVNDIYVRGKKVCGILTEASLDFESGGVSYAVLGIGININEPDNGYPEGLRDIVTSLYGKESCPQDIRQRLIASVLDNFLIYYQNLTAKDFMPEYRARSCVIGKDIYVISGNLKEEARAVGIDDDSALIVQYKNGEIRKITSGEISIRVKDNEN